MRHNSGFPSSMWGELFMAGAYLKNKTPHKALKMETLFKILHDEERSQNLRTHQGPRKARRRGLGRVDVQL